MSNENDVRRYAGGTRISPRAEIVTATDVLPLLSVGCTWAGLEGIAQLFGDHLGVDGVEDVVELPLGEDGLREALAFIEEGLRLGIGTRREKISVARAALAAAPLPRERGAGEQNPECTGGADLVSGEPKREWPTVMVYPQDDDGHDWRYVISGNGWSAESSGFWETACEAMRAGANAMLDRLAPRLPASKGTVE